MSEFTFACPVCRQHISCERDQAGAEMECPTCYRRIIVPAPPASDETKFILTASEVRNRPVPLAPSAATGSTSGKTSKKSPVAAVVLLFVVAATLAVGFVYRDRLLELVRGQGANEDNRPGTVAVTEPTAPRPERQSPTQTLATPPIPDAPAAGRINGLGFICQRSTIRGGDLTLRQGEKWPPDVGITIYLNAESTESLAGQSLSFSATESNLLRLTLRWKDAQLKAVTKTVRSGYNLRVEFGPIVGKRLSGKIYLCDSGGVSTCIAGTFDAEIREPSSHRQSDQTGAN